MEKSLSCCRSIRSGIVLKRVSQYRSAEHLLSLINDILPRASKIICDSKEAALSETGDLLIPIKDGIISEKDILGSRKRNELGLRQTYNIEILRGTATMKNGCCTS
ncbi:hypothetical protein [Dorea sp. AM13-35]|uniref:hypothetical protein n=1 Tax=Dorea sp. AM13-35 TaxID=2293099 RepID=UPI0018F7BE45|nr:hypothetical protein [Dorea sp. AM13-35]